MKKIIVRILMATTVLIGALFVLVGINFYQVTDEVQAVSRLKEIDTQQADLVNQFKNTTNKIFENYYKASPQMTDSLKGELELVKSACIKRVSNQLDEQYSDIKNKYLEIVRNDKLSRTEKYKRIRDTYKRIRSEIILNQIGISKILEEELSKRGLLKTK